MCLKPPSLKRHLYPTIRVHRAITQASNIMIKSSLLKTRLRLPQCCDRELTYSCVTQNGSVQSPCSLWEQEFRSSRLRSEPLFHRYPSTVNRVFYLMSGGKYFKTLFLWEQEPEPTLSTFLTVILWWDNYCCFLPLSSSVLCVF